MWERSSIDWISVHLLCHGASSFTTSQSCKQKLTTPSIDMWGLVSWFLNLSGGFRTPACQANSQKNIGYADWSWKYVGILWIELNLKLSGRWMLWSCNPVRTWHNCLQDLTGVNWTQVSTRGLHLIHRFGPIFHLEAERCLACQAKGRKMACLQQRHAGDMRDSWALHLLTSAMSATLECSTLAPPVALVLPFKNVSWQRARLWAFLQTVFHAAGNVCRVMHGVCGQCVVGNLLAVPIHTNSLCSRCVHFWMSPW